MRIGLLTEGARPYATGKSWLWRGRLVRGLTQRASAFTVPSHSAHRESRGRAPLSRRVNRMRTAPQRDRRGGGRHEVSGGAAALPGPLA
ncbi:transferase, partial [Streptomyces sp. SID10692]|nr:transferase [Streptomyces sp. SID10692]